MSGGMIFIALLAIGVLALFSKITVEYWQNQRLMRHGRAVVATVDAVEVVTCHHWEHVRHYWHVSARWQDPETQQYYYYESDFPYNGPLHTLCPQKNQVNVYIDPRNADKYVMVL